MLNLIDEAVGLLAPPNCVGCGSEGEALCEICSHFEVLPYGEKCWRCGALTDRAATCTSCLYLRAPRHVWITTDYSSKAKSLLKLYKFKHLRAASKPIAQIMYDTLLHYNSDQELNRKNFLLVPVPTATKRIRQRSFDHANLLARHLSRLSGFEHCLAIGRYGQTRQVGATRAERAKQLTGVFYVKNAKEVTGRNILLIDDVITTGATIIEATKTLKNAGAKSVNAVIFAKKL